MSLLGKWLDQRDKRPLYSLCHTTARLPDGWRAAAEAWRNNCDQPELVEHVLVTDELLPPFPGVAIFPRTITGVNPGRRCAVDGWNHSAKLSTGQFLITVADDWFPCPHWDTELLKVIPDFSKDCVVEVATGGDDHLLTFSMLTRSYYERYGYIFYPEYLGMCADNEFTDVAKRDGVVVDARHLYFEHRHPLYGFGEMDAVHKWQHRPEAFDVGKAVYQRRRKELGFPDLEMMKPPAVGARKKLVCCLPGDLFGRAWVAHWTQLFVSLLMRYEVLPVFGYSSNVYTTRASMADSLMCFHPKPDYVLWLDDDNLLSVAHFELLMKDLAEIPDAAVVAGWTWLYPDDHTGVPAVTSVGRWGAQHPEAVTLKELMRGAADVTERDYSGFPAVLMRFSTLEALGRHPFAPIVDDYFPRGYAGDDTGFCKRLGEAGLKLYVDRRVLVPHMKRQPADPELKHLRRLGVA